MGQKFQLPLGSRRVNSYFSGIFLPFLPISPHMPLQKHLNVDPAPPPWGLSPTAAALLSHGSAGQVGWSKGGPRGETSLAHGDSRRRGGGSDGDVLVEQSLGLAGNGRLTMCPSAMETPRRGDTAGTASPAWGSQPGYSPLKPPRPPHIFPGAGLSQGLCLWTHVPGQKPGAEPLPHARERSLRVQSTAAPAWPHGQKPHCSAGAGWGKDSCISALPLCHEGRCCLVAYSNSTVCPDLDDVGLTRI